MRPRIGALFAGYGGLDLAVQSVFPDASLAWVSEFDKGPSKILAHRFPDVPNHGDITRIDWSAVEPVDILTGGSPCQDLSHAGRRAGMTEGTRSNLWVAMREAIARLRPSLVVWENVRGAYSAAADSALEHCPGCMGAPGDRGPVLRALGRVLGDLSDLGYVGGWHGLRAADVGAPHGRFRVFVVARLADAERGGRDGWAPLAWWSKVGRTAAQGSGEGDGRLLPSPRTSDTNGAGAHGDGGLDLRTAVAMLPTPRAHDAKANASAAEAARKSPGLGAVDALLPTPRAGDGEKGGPNQRGSSGDLMLPSAVVARLMPTPTAADSAASGGSTPSDVTLTDAVVRTQMGTQPNSRLLPTPMVGSTNEAAHGQISGDYRAKMDEAFANWGDYADAIHRWEALTRPAPAPTEVGPKGNARLSARFSEFLMGLPDGWVTDVPGITRNEALKALGNGVVPQQAAAALRWLLSWSEVAA